MKKKPRKRKIKAIINFMIIVGILALLMIYIPSNYIKVDKLVYEYGELFELGKEDLVTSWGKSKLEIIDFDFSDVSNVDKDYLEVGKYSITAKYSTIFKKHLKVILLEVKDTTAPVFTSDITEVTVGLDSVPDYSEVSTASDLSLFKVEVDSKGVNFKVPGTYKAIVIAKDIHGNTATKNITIVVTNKPIVSSPKPFYKNGILVVNKRNPLPSTYNPGESKEAGNSVRTMIKDMQALGYNLSSSYSGFRTYERQKELYDYYVMVDGQKLADTYSARPGFSEHQTGLAFDLKNGDGSLVETKPEVDWIAKNAHKYGFIIRYQEDKVDITGYQAEPWHLRYIGDEATAIYNSLLCLEEYLGLDAANGYQ